MVVKRRCPPASTLWISCILAVAGAALLGERAASQQQPSKLLFLTHAGLYKHTSLGPAERDQGGRIIASARASAEVDQLGMTFDLRGVLLDAQTTGGVPTGTSIGVNGLASDLSLLNLIPGFEGSTHHLIVPEPFSSAVLTMAATFLGGD